MIGRLHHLIIDCPEPATLAAFYAEVLGLPVTDSSDDFVVVAANDTTSGLGFQRAPDHRPPAWPDPASPQQMHLDVMVEDVEAAGQRGWWRWAHDHCQAPACTPTLPVTRFA